MKKMRKVFAVLLTAIMTLSMAVSAFAADHTYEVYQIFTGEVSGTTLSNVKWGKNGTGTEGEAVEEKVQNALDEVKNSIDKDVLAVVEDYADLEENPYTTSTSTTITNLPAGYYLIKDKDGSLDGENDAYTTYIVKVINGEVKITPKSGKPTVDKQVQDEVADAETDAVDGWGETADHAINEVFQFKLIATLPSSGLETYEHYYLQFNDTMSKGVAYDGNVTVYVNGNAIGSEDYSVVAPEVGAEERSLTVTINDLVLVTKTETGNGLADAVVTVTYDAHLTENAKVNKESGGTTNKNTVDLDYSNNPNYDGNGTPNDKGKTPEDSVFVFTYEMDNTKVDENNAPLAGAEFKLYAVDGTTETETEIGLIYDNSELFKAYRPVKAGEDAKAMVSAEDTGIFNIKGLDAGTYVLKETKTPAGYNTCADIKIVISATHSESTDGTATTTITMTQDGTETDANTIVNNKGTVLPETGGMGTTIFYVVGVVLVLGAGILLVTKRRMSAR